MEGKENLEKLIADLEFVKTAITKNDSIFKYINIGGRLSRVALAGGILFTLISGWYYLLLSQYGSWPQVPEALKIGTNAGLMIIGIAFAWAKVAVIAGQLKQTRKEMTVLRLFREVYTPQTLTIIIPFVTAMLAVSVFLITREQTLYLVPALSILVGLICIAYVNIFYVKELVVTGDWLLATGLITLFTAETIHPLLALIITFGLGFIAMYVANRILER